MANTREHSTARKVPAVASVPAVTAPAAPPTPSTTVPDSVFPVPSEPSGSDRAPQQVIAELRERIAAEEARLWRLEHPIVEFPKMVQGRTFSSRAEQDAAGPTFADETPAAPADGDNE